MNRMSGALGRAKGLLAGFTPGQRGVIVVAVLGLLLGVYALSRWAAQPTWTPLYSGLSAQDTSKIVDQLQTDGVKYQLSGGGNTILVPQSQVYDLRVQLQGKNLPGSTSDGYSILDAQGMTSTDLQQNTALKRATETELTKTLEAMDGVQAARVQLALPEKNVFTTEQDKAKATVVLQLATGVTLSDEQIASVTQIVSGAVPGLSADNVNVSDTAGHVLSAPGLGTSGTARVASRNDEQTSQYETRLGSDVQKMLDSVLGPGKAVVRVNAQLNFDATERTSERYVQESPSLQPLSEATAKEWYGNGAAANGGNLGGTFPTLTPTGTGAASAQYVKENRTADNAIGKIVEHAQAAPGSVQRLTVAVVLDSKTTAGVSPAQVQALVSNAVGLNTARGDAVQVSALPFDTTASKAAAQALADQQKADRLAGYIDLGKKAGIGLMVLVGLFLLTRRRKSSGATVEAVASDLPEQGALGAGFGGPGMPPMLSALPALTEDEEELAIDPSFDRDKMRDEVAELVDNQPDEIAAVITSWLSERK